MFLRNWSVIVVLALIGLALGAYWLSLPSVPEGVTPQGNGNEAGGLLSDGNVDAATKAVAALAGAITTLGGAIFGLLGKLNDYRKVKLEIREKELALEERRQKSESA